MAILRFTGATDGDLAKVANYQEFTGGAWTSASAIPANGDTLLLMTPGVDVDGGSTLSAVNLALLAAYPSFNGRFGSDSAPVQLGTTTLVEWRAGGPAAYLTGALTKAIVGIDPRHRFVVTGGTTTLLHQIGSKVEYGTSAVLTTFRKFGGELVLRSNATDVTLGHNASGRVKTDSRDIDTYHGDDGSVIETDGRFNVVANMYLARRAKWLAGSYGTVAVLELKPDAQAVSRFTGEATTISQLDEWQGSIIDDDVPGSNFTVSARTTVGATSYGGTFPIAGV